MVRGQSRPQYDPTQQEHVAHVCNGRQEADMNMELEVRRHVQQRSPRWADAMQFVCSVLALWAVCAAGIYLIGPSESDIAAEQGLGAHALESERVPLATAAYNP
jgi:hypothetical protein